MRKELTVRGIIIGIIITLVFTAANIGMGFYAVMAAARGFQVLGIVVEMNQTPDVVRAVAHDLKVNYPILWDEGGEIQDRYKVAYIPQNFLVGKDGIIRYAGNSLPDNYEALVESLLKDGDPRPASR